MRVDLIKRFIFSNPKRQINFIKNYLAFLFKSVKPFGWPSRLMIEPANFCNLRCPSCPVGLGQIKKAAGTMKLENFEKIIAEAGDYLYHLTLWNWGEPFLNRDLPAMIACARRKNIYVVTSTNGHFLNEKICIKLIDSGLNELIIALDGLSQKTLSAYRVGADFNKIISGIKTLVKLKKSRNSVLPKIQLQFIAMKHNQHEIKELKKFAAELGIDKVVIKTFGSSLDMSWLNQFEPDDKNFSRYSWPVKKKKSCLDIYLGMNINYDGTVVPCCYDPQELHKLGNVFESGVQQVWQSNQFVNFRRAVIKNKQAIDICANCDFNENISRVVNLKKHEPR